MRSRHARPALPFVVHDTDLRVVVRAPSLWAPMLAAVAIATPVLVSSPARAAHRFGETVVVEPDEVVPENLTLAGGRVVVRGTVEGDLVALGSDVLVDGTVSGDVFAAGGQVTVAGRAGGDVRALGGELAVRAPVPGELAAAGGTIVVDDAVEGSLMLAGGSVDIRGPVGRDALIAGNDMRVDGEMGGDVWAQGSMLTLGPHARVAGDVDARTERDVVLAPGATITGALRQARLDGRAPAFDALVAWLQLFVGFAFLTMLWRTLFPAFSARTSTLLREHPGRSALIGAATSVAVPVALTLIVVIGGLIGGWWLALVGGCAYLVAVALTVPVVALAIAPRAAPAAGWTRRDTAVLGLVLALHALLFVMPGIGPAAFLLTLWAGLGALASSARRTLRPAVAAPPAMSGATTDTPDRATEPPTGVAVVPGAAGA